MSDTDSTEDRNAIRKAAAASVSVSSTAKFTVDVYARECSSIIVPGLTKHVCIDRVIQRMCLKLQHDTPDMIIFGIEHSTVYTKVQVVLQAGVVSHYTLV